MRIIERTAVAIVLASTPALGGINYFCFGSGGVGGDCPCATTDQSLTNGAGGCGNSLNPEGAILRLAGVPSVGDDTDGTPTMSATIIRGAAGSLLLFQGTVQTPPAAFGDGLRCVAGTVTRLGVETFVARSAFYAEGSFGGCLCMPLAQAGAVPAVGGTRYYQVWYRNVEAGFCTPSNFNLSNAAQVDWVL